MHLVAQRLEEPFELGYDVAFDVPLDGGKGTEDVFAPRDSLIAERYVRGDLEIQALNTFSKRVCVILALYASTQ